MNPQVDRPLVELEEVRDSWESEGFEVYQECWKSGDTSSLISTDNQAVT